MTYIPENLRRLVRQRANGYCEYCLLDETVTQISHEIDHIIAEKHRGTTVESNLTYACFDCNRHKGTDYGSFDPETEEHTMLFNPRMDRWNDHFRLNGGIIEPLTATGRVTVFLMRFNDPSRVAERAVLIAANLYPPQR